VRWLKTVVKHDALALRRQRERHSPITDNGRLGERPTPPGITHDQAALYERLHQCGEASPLLKPQEIRPLRLKAEGYSYREVCQITGWSYTKVNRCLTEGRQALRRRAAAIDRGEECKRLLPLLTDAAGHLAGTSEVRGLQRQIRGCLHCRARLRSLPGGQCSSEDARHPSAFPRGDATRGRSDACRALGPRWPCDEQDARYGWAGTAWLGRQRPRRREGPAGSQRVSGGGPRRSRFLSAAPGGVLNPRCRERPGRSLTKRGEPTMERSCAPPRSARACTAATPPTRAKAHEAWVWVPDRPATDERRGKAVARQCPARRRQGLRSDAG
jgi:hypothetical protein